MIIGFQPVSKTHFKCGHERVPGNIYVKSGERGRGARWECRQCNLERSAVSHKARSTHLQSLQAALGDLLEAVECKVTDEEVRALAQRVERLR